MIRKILLSFTVITGLLVLIPGNSTFEEILKGSSLVQIFLCVYYFIVYFKKKFLLSLLFLCFLLQYLLLIKVRDDYYSDIKRCNIAINPNSLYFIDNFSSIVVKKENVQIFKNAFNFEYFLRDDWYLLTKNKIEILKDAIPSMQDLFIARLDGQTLFMSYKLPSDMDVTQGEIKAQLRRMATLLRHEPNSIIAFLDLRVTTFSPRYHYFRFVAKAFENKRLDSFFNGLLPIDTDMIFSRECRVSAKVQ